MAGEVITGKCLPPGDFSVVETQFNFSEADILRLIDGQLAAMLIRDALPAPVCRTLVKRFWASDGRRPRPDGVDGYFLGAYHYGKSFETYNSDVRNTESYVESFFQGIPNPVDLVMNGVRQATASRGIDVRRAQWRGAPAAMARALAWSSQGNFLLAPHDDVGQLCFPGQADFEIQEVVKFSVLAVNVYPHVPENGGRLRIWNILPDDNSRRRLGIENTGYPYPNDTLDGISFLDVPVESGAIVIANGGLVHAVTAYDHESSVARERLLVNFFFGQVNPTTIVHWV